MPSNDTTASPQQHVGSTEELGAPLRPCPWCRAHGVALMELWDTFDAGHIAHVHCSRCGAFGPSVYGERGVKAACEDASKKWNQRATPNASLSGGRRPSA